MAKKTTTKEPMILQYSEMYVDLATRDPKKMKEYAEYVAAMLQSPGWLIMSKILEENAKVLETQIIAKVDEEGNPITEDEVDLIRVHHAQIKQLLNKPRELVRHFSGDKKVAHTPEMDVYKTIQEGGVYASTLTDTT